jgi:hypothetical protein
MTDSQFETLRQELRALWSDIDQRFDTVGTRLTKLEVQLDSKPDKAFVFQTLFTVNASFLALFGLILIAFRTFFIPA